MLYMMTSSTIYFLLINSFLFFAISIRAMCGMTLEKNCVHGSDSFQSAQREIAYFFDEKSSGKISLL